MYNFPMTHPKPLKPVPQYYAVNDPLPTGLEFPGCKPVHLPCGEIETYDGRLEFSGTPAPRPPGYARRARLPGPAAMVVSENDFPDVVLEVDYSTDVRRGKLGLYESWGFPEVWVEVPDRRAPSRPRGRMAGLTIHVLEAGAYRVSGESRAFPGWTAQDIHAALNETTPSARTYAVVERVATELGAREGTGPEDDPLLRSQRRQGRAEGIRQGLGHERELLRRLAAVRFSADTAERLSGLLDGIADPDRLAETGEWIVRCDSGSELLNRVGLGRVPDESGGVQP